MPPPRRRLPSVSLCIIAKDEEANLDRCLSSVSGVVDEIVLVDTGSTDRTVAIAQRCGARVFYDPWQDDFARPRNAGLEQAAGDWILVLDADEALAPESGPRLKSALSETGVDALLVCVRSFNPPGSIADHYDSPQVRLFRSRPEFRFEYCIHTQVIGSIQRSGGVIAPSDLLILHYGYMHNIVQGGASRQERTLRLLKKALARQPESAYLHAKLGFAYFETGSYAQAVETLKRVLFELDVHSLDADFVHQIMAVLGRIALEKGEYPDAIHYALGGLELNAQDALTLSSLKTLARSWMRLGDARLQGAAPGDGQPRRGGESASDETFLLAQSRMRPGDARLQSAAPGDGQTCCGGESAPEDAVFLARLAYGQALEAYRKLLSHPGLSPAARPELDAEQQRCQERLNSSL